MIECKSCFLLAKCGSVLHWWSIFVTATGKMCMKKLVNLVIHSYLNQKSISDNVLVTIKLGSGLTILGSSENNLWTDLDHLSSKFNFLILFELTLGMLSKLSKSLFINLYNRKWQYIPHRVFTNIKWYNLFKINSTALEMYSMDASSLHLSFSFLPLFLFPR